MIVRSGWSSEYARQKYDVEVDMDDLRRLLADNGVKAQPEDMSVDDVHVLLWTTAEILARRTLVQFLVARLGKDVAKGDDTVKKASREAHEFMTKRQAVLARLSGKASGALERGGD
jgi:hypothetical protein